MSKLNRFELNRGNCGGHLHFMWGNSSKNGDLCNVDPFEGDWRYRSKIIIARILWIGRCCREQGCCMELHAACSDPYPIFGLITLLVQFLLDY